MIQFTNPGGSDGSHLTSKTVVTIRRSGNNCAIAKKY
jgi:hypothetical protein